MADLSTKAAPGFRSENAPPRTVAIVDPYDAGSNLALAFAQKGVSAIMVGSTPDIAPQEGTVFDPDTFRRLLFWQDDMAQLVETLRHEGVTHVLAGSERGTILTDHLAEALGLPGNGTALSLARRDKFIMIEQVRRAGLRAPPQMQSDRLDDILKWVDQHCPLPVVLKPPQSKGADGVRLCRSRDAVAQAFADIYDKTDTMGHINRTVLAQAYVCGTEYVLDTVSVAGNHRLAGVWAYGKPEADYDTIGLISTKELLNADSPLAERLFAFAAQVLDALGIVHGAGHCEIIVDQHGPVLVEAASRLHGGPAAHRMSFDTLGFSQMDLLVQSCLQPDQFLKDIHQRYPLPGGAVMALLRDKTLQGMIEMLPSVRTVSWSETVRPTPNAVFGLATLIHPERAVVAADLSIITCRYDTLKTRTAVEALAPAWQALLRRSHCNRAFGSPAWYLAALDAQPHLSPWVVTAYRNNELVGVLALVKDSQTCRFATNLSDYNDVVVSANDHATAQGLLLYARHHLSLLQPARLELDCIRADAACAAGAALTAPATICPFADISRGYEKWLETRSKRFQTTLKAAEKRAAAHGLFVEKLTPSRHGHLNLSDLFLALHRERFGAASLFAHTPTAAAFVKAALPRLFHTGDAMVFGLWAQGHLIGLNLCMVGPNSLGYWNAGFKSAFAQFSPGTLMIHAALREAVACGFAEFDYLRGPEAYKMKWATDCRTIGRLP
ncbi:GNAT family N-acetyltransferase [Allorhizobium terrae]|uniref:GNAT family N-acetyltransferase n=1 Tax=Allorhizobium terrae TaxID=1848972 RepID=A0A4S3ZRU2_9HYPH|nr:GNAT family N-acetyltransferase [Allorhizobium terrae]THF48348.1 GNAT family N-acetyltransferase [Allorhizobium terrae]